MTNIPQSTESPRASINRRATQPAIGRRSLHTLQALSAIGLAAILLTSGPAAIAANPSVPTPTCAWPFEWTPFGTGNWLWADTANRWWYMPIDKDWQRMKITGNYPRARFFSLATYNDAPVSTGLASRLYDAQIAPAPGSCNPFSDPQGCTTLDGTYEVTIKRDDASVDNGLRVDARTGWLLYRLYLPNANEDSMGAVPLPRIEVTRTNGKTAVLPKCSVVNRRSELAQLQPQMIPAELEDPLAYLSIPPVPDRIWFGAIRNPPAALLPNPDNKYLISFFMPAYKLDRIVVIRGKMPAFPDTWRGQPISEPAPGFDKIQLRYWGTCQGELVSPLPLAGCANDANTPLDQDGFYTIVVTNDVLRPDWVPQGVVWLPWGDESMVPKVVFMRNLLAADDFTQSVQSAITQGCGFDMQFPVPPTQQTIEASGRCSKAVMGDYYPEAVWCDRQLFVTQGTQACLEAAPAQ